MSKVASIKNFFSNIKLFGKLKEGKLAGIYDDLKNIDNIKPQDLSPEGIGNWFDTRIFGKRKFSRDLSAFDRAHQERFDLPIDKWTANTGALSTIKNTVTSQAALYSVYGAAGTYGAYKVAGGIDRVAGFMHGGPGYGGYIGWGEGTHSETNALQGAQANMNYQAQMMGLQALSSNQIAPQYSLTIAPMRQRRASAALRNSTEGLAFGLHNGRHGGY